MKVLVAGSTFPRWPDDRLPDFLWQQVQWLGRVADVRVSVLAPHDRGAAAAETWEGVPIRRFRYFVPAVLERLVYPAIWPNLRRHPWLIVEVPFLLIAEFFATLRWIRQERFDMVYSHWFMPQGVACGLAALVTGTPHVFTSHSSDVALMRKLPGLGPWLVRFLVRRARAITAVSTRSRDIIAGFFSAAEWSRLSPRVAVIPMGVDASAFPETRDGSPRELLFVGRLAEKKGVEYLLDAMTLEPLRSLDVRLSIAGDGPMLAALKARAATLGLDDRVRFLGFVTGPDKAECFRRAGIVVIPSIITASGDAEGLPVVLLEAMAAGKVCVATDASGAPDIVGDAAFVVPEQDAQALADAVARAVRLSEVERQELSGRAQAIARRYQWGTVAREHARHLFGVA